MGPTPRSAPKTPHRDQTVFQNQHLPIRRQWPEIVGHKRFQFIFIAVRPHGGRDALAERGDHCRVEDVRLANWPSLWRSRGPDGGRRRRPEAPRRCRRRCWGTTDGGRPVGGFERFFGDDAVGHGQDLARVLFQLVNAECVQVTIRSPNSRFEGGPYTRPDSDSFGKRCVEIGKRILCGLNSRPPRGG